MAERVDAVWCDNGGFTWSREYLSSYTKDFWIRGKINAEVKRRDSEGKKWYKWGFDVTYWMYYNYISYNKVQEGYGEKP